MDYTNLKEPKRVKLKHVNAARWGYDPEVRKVFAVMKDKAFIDRSLSSHGNVDTVPDGAYNDLRNTLQTLHEDIRSAPDGGALAPALVEKLPGEAILSRKRQGKNIPPSWLSLGLAVLITA